MATLVKPRIDGPRIPIIHALKCWPEYFAPVVAGDKLVELRRDDRGFQTSDFVWLQEWEPPDPDRRPGARSRAGVRCSA